MTTTEPKPSGPFTATTSQNPYVAAEVDTMEAIITVQAATGDVSAPADAKAGPGDRAEIIILDTSRSMSEGEKMPEAVRAAQAAVACLQDGVRFAIVAGTHEVRTIWPTGGNRALAVASQDEREKATQAVASQQPEGGTRIGTWLRHARDLFEQAEKEQAEREEPERMHDETEPEAEPQRTPTRIRARHAVLFTDGRNEHQTAAELNSDVEACQGVFQCDCRGLGADWKSDELRSIATGLQGNADIVPDPSDLHEHFQSMISRSQRQDLPNVRLRVWTPPGATLEPPLRQVDPVVEGVMPADPPSPGGPPEREGKSASSQDFLLGGWAPSEVRKYRVRIRVTPGAVGVEPQPVCSAQLVLHDGTVAAEAVVQAAWTHDVALSRRIDPELAHYREQEKLADAVDDAMKALKAGDKTTAGKHLNDAWKIADKTGHAEKQAEIRQLADVDDASGKVRVKEDVSKVDQRAAEIHASRSVSFRPRPDEHERRRARRTGTLPDLHVVVDENREVKLYRADTTVTEEPCDEPLPSSDEARAKLDGFIERQAARGEASDDPERELLLIGQDIAQSLPRTLLEALADGEDRTILIQHPGHIDFPFELALIERGDDKYFLGELHQITRWIRGGPDLTSDFKAVNRMALAFDSRSLEGADDTLAAHRDMVSRLFGHQQFQDDLGSLREQVFRTEAFDIIHLVSHLEAQGSVAGMLFGDKFLRPNDFLAEDKTFGPTTALVLVNGCSSARSTQRFFLRTSFPRELIRMEVKSVIATVLPVEPRLAVEFATCFLEAFGGGATFGEALRGARAELTGRGDSDIDTARRRRAAVAYSGFGHPNFTIHIAEGEQQGA